MGQDGGVCVPASTALPSVGMFVVASVAERMENVLHIKRNVGEIKKTSYAMVVVSTRSKGRFLP